MPVSSTFLLPRKRLFDPCLNVRAVGVLEIISLSSLSLSLSLSLQNADSLQKKLRNRPERQNLMQMNILPGKWRKEEENPRRSINETGAMKYRLKPLTSWGRGCVGL